MLVANILSFDLFLGSFEAEDCFEDPVGVSLDIGSGYFSSDTALEDRTPINSNTHFKRTEIIASKHTAFITNKLLLRPSTNDTKISKNIIPIEKKYVIHLTKICP